MTISQYIDAARVARGYSYEKLAQESGVSKGYLFSLINNNTNVGIYTLAKIAKALDIRLSDVVSVLDTDGTNSEIPLPFEELP